MSIILGIMLGSAAISCTLWAGLYLRRRAAALRSTRQLRNALSTCHAVFTALESVPSTMLSRDLRKGLVLMVSAHLDRLKIANPEHPHLHHMRRKVAQLNRIPTGLKREPLRSKSARQAALVAFEKLAVLLRSASVDGLIKQKTADLARASALYAAQQLAIEIARRSAQDAEHVKAYPQALRFAYQAQGLCRKLPPATGQSLNALISQDIERIQARLPEQARI